MVHPIHSICKGLCIVIWDRNDYIAGVESQLKTEVVYQKITFKHDMICDLVTKRNGFFKNLKRSRCIMEKRLKYLFQVCIQKDHQLRKVVGTSEN